MKKSIYLGIIALATLSMTSCSKDDVVESVPQQHAIEFGTYLGHDVQSRGVELNNANFNEFGVFAFYTGPTAWQSFPATAPNFMYNQSVSRTAKTDSDDWNAWTYSPKKYWPTTQGDKITFFAYAPMAANDNGISVSANTAKGTPVVTYEITDENLETLGDFVADAKIDEVRTTGNTDTTTGGNNNGIDDEYETVSFRLLHELTRVGIQAKLSKDAWSENDTAEKTKVNITSINLTGDATWGELYTKADYTFAQTDDNSATDNTNEVRGTWNITDATKVASLNINNLLAIATPANLGGYDDDGVLVESTTPVSIFGDTQNLFLIPCNGTTGLTTGKVKMEVAYDIVTVDDKLEAGHSVTSATKIIELPEGILKQGTAYTLTLTFGLNEIILEADLDNWDNATQNENVDWPKTDK